MKIKITFYNYFNKEKVKDKTFIDYQFDFLPCISLIKLNDTWYSLIFQWLFYSIDITFFGKEFKPF